jgi:MFS family permease
MRAKLPPEYQDLLRGPTLRYYCATFVSALGTGLILSLNVLYIHNVRHESYWFAGTLLSMTAVAGLALAPLSGTITDRFGPIRPMLFGIVTTCIAEAMYAFATTKPAFIWASLIMIFGGGLLWGPGSVLITRMVDVEQRSNAYGLNFQLLNLGIGFGALISSFVVNESDPTTFTNLYLANAALSFLPIFFLVSLWKFGQALPPEQRRHETTEGGWKEVIADRRLVRYIGFALIVMVCGYGSIESGFSVFVKNVAHLSIHFIGVTFFFNTTTIVVAQVAALRFIKGRSRTQVLGIVGALWGVSWFMVAATVFMPKWFALAALCLSTTIFAVGETLWQPVSAALVNELAPERLRGRYNSAAGMTWGVSASLAPWITTTFIVLGAGREWPIVVGVGALVGGYFLTTLKRHLSTVENGLLDALGEPLPADY